MGANFCFHLSQTCVSRSCEITAKQNRMVVCNNMLMLFLESKVNAKIADYGIACHVGAMHISASVGTPGKTPSHFTEKDVIVDKLPSYNEF